MKAGFLFAGGFSLINAALGRALREELVREEAGQWRGELEEVAVGDLLRRQFPLRMACLTLRAAWFFRKLILGQRIPPRDLVVRLPGVSELIPGALAERAKGWSWTLQTQTLFDANPGAGAHYIYTDHTYRANWRYAPPRQTWPVYRGWEELEKRAYARARRIFVSSKFAADSLVEDYGIGAEGVVVVGSGSNVKPPVEVGPRGGGRILFVGVEWERKGGPQLLRAFEQLRAKYPQVELDVVGCEGTHGAAKFHGRMAADRVRQFYERADIFCLPSLAEPSASVLAEAAAFALPIVGTRVGGTPERVIDGETGWLVEPGAVEPLALALERLVAHPAAARAMGDRGRALALEHFTWAAVAKKIRSGISQSLK